MTSTFPEISLSTERLVLRPFEEGDVPAYVEMMNEELMRAWTSVPVRYTEQDAREWINRSAPEERNRGWGIAFAVTELLTGRLIGMVLLRNTDWRCRSTEVAYGVAPWARGEGYAPEAVLGLAHWLFQDQRFERLELRTAADNAAAQQVAQKVGCISEGVLRSAGIVRVPEAEGPDGQVRTDLIVWSLLPEDLDGALHSAAEAAISWS
jgi:RimJ/RimL family protein N-acetyltransferase